MNERIKELAVQADLLIKKSNGDEFQYGNFDPRFQKFAELIVRECARVAFESDLTMAIGQWGADSAILKHFGDEE